LKPKENQNKVILGNAPVAFKVFQFDTVKVNNWGKVINTEHHEAQYLIEDLGDGITLEMIEIQGGTFMMGFSLTEKSRGDNNSLHHEVTVPSFHIAKFPITQIQWRQVATIPKLERELLSTPSAFKGKNLPVEKVSWYDAVEFCQRLCQVTGKKYRLPSEAQWEYACRAKTMTPFHFGAGITTRLANYNGKYTYFHEPKGEYRQKTTPVGSFPPNAFGLYDMHGNVWEWCEDSWHNNYEGAPNDGSSWISPVNLNVLRGGSWGSRPGFCHAAHREQFRADKFDNFIGFRCVIIKEMSADKTI
jgi:formylglycine-generating enzyme required for sulfatase activity